MDKPCSIQTQALPPPPRTPSSRVPDQSRAARLHQTSLLFCAPLFECHCYSNEAPKQPVHACMHHVMLSSPTRVAAKRTQVLSRYAVAQADFFKPTASVDNAC